MYHSSHHSCAHSTLQGYQIHFTSCTSRTPRSHQLSQFEIRDQKEKGGVGCSTDGQSAAVQWALSNTPVVLPARPWREILTPSSVHGDAFPEPCAMFTLQCSHELRTRTVALRETFRCPAPSEEGVSLRTAFRRRCSPIAASGAQHPSPYRPKTTRGGGLYVAYLIRAPRYGARTSFRSRCIPHALY